ncbi:MAG: CarD family transcriptional regulator [Hyphomicrobiaceae bacterium]
MAQSKKTQPAKRTVKTKAAASKAAATKSSAKSKAKASKPAAAKQTVAKKKAPAKAAVAKKPATKKVAAKKPAAKKVAVKTKAKTTTAKKPVAKAAAKKPVAKKAATKKAAAKKPAAKSTKASKKPALTTRDIIAAAAAKQRSAASAKRAVPASVGKAGSGSKITAAVGGGKSKAATAAKAKATVIEAPKDQPPPGPRKPVSQRHGFKINESIVYPSHGVGRIIGIEEQEIAGISLELFVIHFDKEKLTLRVPTGKLESVGMRKLAEEALVTRSLGVLKGRARVKRTMWSRRAQEYIAKINSGDLISIAEVVRDLYRSEAQPEQSYSERQLYEDALDRMAREVAAVENIDDRGAVQRIIEILSKSAKTRTANEEAAAAAAKDEESDDTDGGAGASKAA